MNNFEDKITENPNSHDAMHSLYFRDKLFLQLCSCTHNIDFAACLMPRSPRKILGITVPLFGEEIVTIIDHIKAWTKNDKITGLIYVIDEDADHEVILSVNYQSHLDTLCITVEYTCDGETLDSAICAIEFVSGFINMDTIVYKLLHKLFVPTNPHDSIFEILQK